MLSCLPLRSRQMNFTIYNPFTRQKEDITAEDCGEGFVVRIINPKNPTQVIVNRPYYLVDEVGRRFIKITGEPFIYFSHPGYRQRMIEMKVGRRVETFTLVPVFRETFGCL
jgi:hypothetical protein